MKIQLIACFVILLFVTAYAAKKKSVEDKEAEKAAKEAEKSSKRFADLVNKMASSPVVSLTDTTFNKFVVERPRDYHALLMFTATDKKYQCSVCLRAKMILDDVAKYYQDQYDFNSSSISERLAFFRIEVDDARNTFGEMQLETVPRVYLLPPTNSSSPKMRVSDFEVEAGALMQGASVALEEITRSTGIKVFYLVLYLSMVDRPSQINITIRPEPLLLVLGVIGVLVALFVAAASGDVYAALLWYQSPKIWVVVSIVSSSFPLFQS